MNHKPCTCTAHIDGITHPCTFCVYTCACVRRWFLHLFVDADKKSPTYGQPVRFYGPYSGFAVYIAINKTQPPAEVWDTACVGDLNGWPSSEKKCLGKKITDYPCMVVGNSHKEVCDAYVNASAAAKVEEQEEFETYKGAFGTLRIPRNAEQVISAA